MAGVVTVVVDLEQFFILVIKEPVMQPNLVTLPGFVSLKYGLRQLLRFDGDAACALLSGDEQVVDQQICLWRVVARLDVGRVPLFTCHVVRGQSHELLSLSVIHVVFLLASLSGYAFHHKPSH